MGPSQYKTAFDDSHSDDAQQVAFLERPFVVAKKDKEKIQDLFYEYEKNI